MKGLLFWSLFAAFYVLIILLFQASAAEEPGIENVKQPSPVVNPVPVSPVSGFNQPQNNLTAGIVGLLQSVNWDLLGISSPAARQSINDMYGSFSGNIECQKKSICVFGNYLHNLPGRDIIFLILSQYVPSDWGILYDIFRISVMYGQNCELFICNATPSGVQQVPPPLNPSPVPVPPTPTPAAPTSTSTSRPATTTPKEEEFDNEIHKIPQAHAKPRNF